MQRLLIAAASDNLSENLFQLSRRPRPVTFEGAAEHAELKRTEDARNRVSQESIVADAGRLFMQIRVRPDFVASDAAQIRSKALNRPQIGGRHRPIVRNRTAIKMSNAKVASQHRGPRGSSILIDVDKC